MINLMYGDSDFLKLPKKFLLQRSKNKMREENIIK